MRAARVIVALGLLACAVVAAQLALDVRAWRDELGADDARFAAGERADWSRDERLPGSPVEALLGLDDDRAARAALARFRRARVLSRDRLRRQEAEGVRGEAGRALAAVAAGSGPAASQANVLLGVLGFDEPEGPERALRAFRRALVLDGGNDAAKFDLELVLRLLTPVDVRPGEGRGRGAGRSRGAGAGEEGGGY